jgi:hypothetical protein
MLSVIKEASQHSGIGNLPDPDLYPPAKAVTYRVGIIDC